MDWCCDTRVAGAAARLEHEVLGHLSRHAADSGTVKVAVPLVAGTLEEACRAREGVCWISLDWDRRHPELAVQWLRPGPWPPPGLVAPELVPCGDGVARAGLARAKLMNAAAGQFGVAVTIEVARPAEPDIDPPLGDLASDLGPLDASTLLHEMAAALAVAADGHSSAEEGAARAGARLGWRAEQTYRATRGLADDPLTTGQVGETILSLAEATGGRLHLVEDRDDWLVFRATACPLGVELCRPSLCRVLSAAAGGLAARAAGSAHVTLSERMCLGDPETRLAVEFGGGPPRQNSHRYSWPPAGSPDVVAGAAEDRVVPGVRVELAFRLPHDAASVPLVRHLAGHALAELNVRPDVADDIELALTEACANVMDHAGPGEAYNVELVIGRGVCQVRILDAGPGVAFVAPGDMPLADAEEGRGIALMHALMDRVRFRAAPQEGTVVHMEKQLFFQDATRAEQRPLAPADHDPPSADEEGLPQGGSRRSPPAQ